MVGGSGLYIDSVLYDYSFLPTKGPYTRQILNDLSEEELINLARQAKLDSSTIDVKNKRRLIRLLETYGQKPTKKALRANTLVIGLKVERSELNDRLKKRLNNMIDEGLEKEVFNISNEFGWGCEALKGIGYMEWQDFFLGTASRSEVQEKILKDSLDLAKRQRTWFKRNQSIYWLSTPINCIEVVDLVTTHLGVSRV
jgi:tRNA dimethylallyltransferase